MKVINSAVNTVFVIRDNVTGVTSPLFLSPSWDGAKREFAGFLSDPKLSAPADYDLYAVASFDKDSLSFGNFGDDRYDYPTHIVNGAAVGTLLTGGN